jgi:HAD superfamily hydrolase (TIGR01509 family)
MIEAVLFDNDGVLVDTEYAFFEVTRNVFAGAGAALTIPYWSRAYLGEGKTSREIANDLGIPRGQIETIIEQRNRIWRERMEAGVPLRHGVRRTLEALYGRVRMAVVTGSPRDQYELVHRSTGLSSFFETVLTEDDFERSKPHPDAYIAALRRLGLPARLCVAVEDSPRGIAAAHAAGLCCILVPTVLTDREMCSQADWIIPDIGGVEHIVLKEKNMHMAIETERENT